MSERPLGYWAMEQRRERVARFTAMAIAFEGQDLDSFLNQASLALGASPQRVADYWERISNKNRGPIYVKDGVIKVRKPFRKWLDK